MKEIYPSGTATSAFDRASDNLSSQTRTVGLLLVLTAILLTRFSWAPLLLWTDTVNLAYSLESFEPLHHQPQPPGYPLFVAVARVIHRVSPNAEVTFWIISVLATVASAGVIYFLGSRMVSRWVGLAALILLVVNPVFWFARLRTPLRPWLAFFSCLVAYCAWRCWHGERRFAFWGAVALGTGAGFRPDLLAYLFPLWIVSAWVGTRSWKTVAGGLVIIGTFSAVWLGTVVYASGGIAVTIQMMTSYLLEQSSRDSVLFAESTRDWLRPLSRWFVWNATAVAGWIWAPLIGFRHFSVKSIPWLFFMVWLVPGLLSQLFIHIASPDHTLFGTPALCLIGAYCIHRLGVYRDAILFVALLISAALFLNIVPTGDPAPADASSLAKTWISVRNSVAYGTFETSQDRLRWWDDIAQTSLSELRQLMQHDRPNVIVALNGTDKEFDFINWRVVSYYMDGQPLWVLMDNFPTIAPGRIRLVRRENIQPVQASIVRLPANARILWIMLPGGRFHRALADLIPLQRRQYILYSDIPAGAGPFEVEGFRFIPNGIETDVTKLLAVP